VNTKISEENVAFMFRFDPEIRNMLLKESLFSQDYCILARPNR
jgi:hypothetical protein